jgi:hypothetical protein
MQDSRSDIRGERDIFLNSVAAMAVQFGHVWTGVWDSHLTIFDE